ncbi:MAG: hypothetical protein U5K69_00590 [Balneolaceae bacterium]|nr:hypothetical protein [Balneolaceae bacterium]
MEILEEHFPTYHVRDAEEIDGPGLIQHFNQWDKEIKQTENWLPVAPSDEPVTISLTSGASCPDVLVDEVLLKILSYFQDTRDVEEVIKPFKKKLEEVA